MGHPDRVNMPDTTPKAPARDTEDEAEESIRESMRRQAAQQREEAHHQREERAHHPSTGASGAMIEEDHLRQFIDRIERLEEEKAGIMSAVKDIYQEAKSVGFDPKIMRQIIRLRKMDPNEIDEQEILLHTYKKALGME
ncbi:hypothetical protein MAIT1_03384 [Magnetofaba australis IT-1]|uniref:GapR-like DNA-binding domain-containing protein n=2 Tax=Magnetofaba TaxID=1472292 RepID=A0A1Y2K6E1_9PROT|nr:hypothetical protein MAIT1_03384 [Magnetofaba australis IT-1]